MKNRLSALQSQLEAQLGSEHKGSNLSLSHPPTMQQPDQIFMSSENKENPVRNSEKEKNPIRYEVILDKIYKTNRPSSDAFAFTTPKTSLLDITTILLKTKGQMIILCFDY